MERAVEVILLILAATYAVSGKHTKDTSLAAYKAGKEPPGLVKARLRHEAGGGRFVTRPGKDKQQPKGPGATRLLIASRWANACEKSKTRGEDKLKRWQAWYDERAPHRDKAWRDKQNRKMDKRAERLDKWQGRWTRTKNAKDAAKDAFSRRGEESEPEASSAGNTPEQPAEQQPSKSDEPLKVEFPTVNANERIDKLADHDRRVKEARSSTNTTEEGDAVYTSGAATMHNHAAEVEGYQKALTALGQDMADVKWGAEVHGPLADMHTKLKSVAARYRNLAETVKHQGDNVNDAYDDAPWSPDHQVLTQ